jgi:hypothetical protein
MPVDLVNLADKIERFMRKNSSVTESKNFESYRFVQTEDRRVEIWQTIQGFSRSARDPNWYLCRHDGTVSNGTDPWVVQKKGHTFAEFVVGYTVGWNDGDGPWVG